MRVKVKYFSFIAFFAIQYRKTVILTAARTYVLAAIYYRMHRKEKCFLTSSLFLYCFLTPYLIPSRYYICINLRTFFSLLFVLFLQTSYEPFSDPTVYLAHSIDSPQVYEYGACDLGSRSSLNRSEPARCTNESFRGSPSSSCEAGSVVGETMSPEDCSADVSLTVIFHATLLPPQTVHGEHRPPIGSILRQ